MSHARVKELVTELLKQYRVPDTMDVRIALSVGVSYDYELGRKGAIGYVVADN